MAKPREIPDLDPGDTYRAAAIRVVKVRAAEVVEHADGVQDLGEIERLHSMRVATRRLRASLEIFESCFPEEEHAAALSEVKAIADALGERRDRDVAVLALDEFSEGLAAADRRGVASLVEKVRGEQGEINEKLGEWISADRLDALSATMAKLVAGR